MSEKLIEALSARVHELERRLDLRGKQLRRARADRDLWKTRALRYRERIRA